jgi:hypothetical protein
MFLFAETRDPRGPREGSFPVVTEQVDSQIIGAGASKLRSVVEAMPILAAAEGLFDDIALLRNVPLSLSLPIIRDFDLTLPSDDSTNRHHVLPSSPLIKL